MEHGCSSKPWLVVQLDADNSETHYLVGITRQFERLLGITPQAAVPPIGNGAIVGSDFSAQEINIENSFNFGDDEYDATIRSEQRAGRIAGVLRERLATSRVGVIFLEPAKYDPAVLRAFRNNYWEQGLVEATSEGLLVLHFCEEKDLGRSSFTGEADLTVRIRSSFDDAALACATEDLAEFFLSCEMERTQDTAMARARGMLQMAKEPHLIYDRLAGAFIPPTSV
jgi:hypothetical protein